MENPVAENMNPDNVLNFNAKTQAKAQKIAREKALEQAAAAAEQGLPHPIYGIAVATEVAGTRALGVVFNETHYNVTHYLSSISGIEPRVQLGDEVLISAIAGKEGVMIHGVLTLYSEQPSRASFGLQDGKLVIEAQGAVILKSGLSTIELTETGEVHIDGKDVRTVADKVRTYGKEIRTIARKLLTLQGSKIDLN